LRKTPIFTKRRFLQKRQFFQKRKFLSIFHEKCQFLQNADFCKKGNLHRSSILTKIRRQRISLRKLGKKFFAESDFCKRLWGILGKSNRIFAKTPIFTRSSILAKIGRQRKSLQKSGKKFCVESDFRKRLWGILGKSNHIFLRKACFLTQKPIFAKQFCKHFCNVCRNIPMG
jgi:hypothetical protein